VKHNIEFSCRPESYRYAAVRWTDSFSTDRTQADNCNDLLELRGLFTESFRVVSCSRGLCPTFCGKGIVQLVRMMSAMKFDLAGFSMRLAIRHSLRHSVAFM